jgi:molybdenum cofactor synthesis domain-containing protein
MNTACVVVIGNEVLSGKVEESNANYLAGEIHALGVDLRSIQVIPDIIEEIGTVVATAAEKYDLVFTTGGVGPTHDDVTLEGIARGLGLRLERSVRFEKLVRGWYGERFTDDLLRMADLPEGSTLLWGDDIPIPVICCRNIYIFPGEPTLLRKKWQAVRDRFRTDPYFTRRIFISAGEEDVTVLLRDAAEAHPDAEIGSYPVYGKEADYRVQVIVESRSEEVTRQVTDYLTGRMPEGSVLRLE